MIGLTCIARIPDSELYEPDASGAWAFITPLLLGRPMSPESRWPDAYVRFGNLVDCCAWDPQTPRQWALWTNLGDWLGCIQPQYLDSERVQVWRSALSWFRAGCSGLVPLSCDPAIVCSVLMGFPGGMVAEDDLHAAQRKRVLERPWPLARICVPALAHEARRAAE